LGNGDASGCHFNLRIRGKGDAFGFIERQGRPGILSLMVFLEQNCHARKAVAPRRRLCAGDAAGRSGCQNKKCSK